ncbi:heterokaryon incompatibility protein Het-C-domain-containing protein [Melampsora americana]|nr:heterokaryon incompatibility protein Het-C-domain-containing protein [Melampsora americana]
MSFVRSYSSASSTWLYPLVFIGLIVCLPGVSAFGSGKIPDAAYLKGKAWRHGDINDVLEGLVKVAGQGGGAIIGAIASAFFNSGSGEGSGRARGGKKFSGLDVKQVYFGNWLRDLSQVCDIAGFKAMTPESLVICIMTMGFLTFGYATKEFEVNREKLAVYLLTEHIDNPKGYGEGEDPQSYDRRLRPRVDEDRELQIDERNGMKKYIASDDEDFDTSTKCIRRTFQKCIQIGREARAENSQEKEHESFRLLGTGLHTLEDFSAHSNWCELALRKLGHKQVFAHVGENVQVNSPDGPVPPLVTGTFAGADFCFSMLGEASDKLSSASIADLTSQMDEAQNQNKQSGEGRFEFIKSILSKLPIGGSSGDATVNDNLDQINQKKKAFDLDGRIDQLAPEQLQKQLWDIFVIRDNLMRRIEELIEGVPGLGELLENLSLALTQYIMITIDPYVRPILMQASTAIGKGSQAVISGNDQWTVFDDPNASDPTHSVLAKDHFSNILNDPAGNISVIIVKNTVNMIVDAWINDDDPDRVIDQILEAIHHPNYASRDSNIQMQMMNYMRKWLDDMDVDDRELTLQSLTKDSVRNHRNQRKTTENGSDPRISSGGASSGHGHSPFEQSQTSYNANQSRPQGRNQAHERPSYQMNDGSASNEYNSHSSYSASGPAKSSQYGQNKPSGSYTENQQGANLNLHQSDQGDLRRSQQTHRPSGNHGYNGGMQGSGYQQNQSVGYASHGSGRMDSSEGEFRSSHQTYRSSGNQGYDRETQGNDYQQNQSEGFGRHGSGHVNSSRFDQRNDYVMIMVFIIDCHARYVFWFQ